MKEKKRGYDIVKDNQLQAVHDDDLISLLISLGIYEKVKNHQINCTFCQKPISEENIGAIIPLDGEIALVCDTPKCLKRMSEVTSK